MPRREEEANLGTGGVRNYRSREGATGEVRLQILSNRRQTQKV